MEYSRSFATIHRAEFREPDVIQPQFFFDPLAELAHTICLSDLLPDNVPVHIRAIYPLRLQIRDGDMFNLYEVPLTKYQGEIIQALGLVNTGKHIESFDYMRRGGASLTGAFFEAAQLAAQTGAYVVIVGVEAIAKEAGSFGLPTSELVRYAGASIYPHEAMGVTLCLDIPMTLITAYAMVESSILSPISGSVDRSLRIGGKRRTKAVPLAECRDDACICSDEPASAGNGAFLAVIGPEKKSENAGAQVYLAAGSVQPERLVHRKWYELPARFNMAYTPIQHIQDVVQAAGLPLINEHSFGQYHTELYECFFIALVQQTAAVLGIKQITAEDFAVIVNFIKKYNKQALSNLREWASWSLSSAKKLDAIYRRLSDPACTRKAALLVGNGGVMDNSVALLMTRDKDLLGIPHHSQLFQEFKVDENILYHLETNTEQLAHLCKSEGTIDMLAYQYPLKEAPGTTFVRVVYPDKRCVVTQLWTGQSDNSWQTKLTNHTAIGATTRLVFNPTTHTFMAII